MGTVHYSGWIHFTLPAANQQILALNAVYAHTCMLGTGRHINCDNFELFLAVLGINSRNGDIVCGTAIMTGILRVKQVHSISV